MPSSQASKRARKSAVVPHKRRRVASRGTATQPIDVVKTRAQSVKGAGVVEATMSVWQDYGIKGFWRGTVMRLGRTVMAGGILFTSYEKIVAILNPIYAKVPLVQ